MCVPYSEGKTPSAGQLEALVLFISAVQYLRLASCIRIIKK